MFSTQVRTLQHEQTGLNDRFLALLLGAGSSARSASVAASSCLSLVISVTAPSSPTSGSSGSGMSMRRFSVFSAPLSSFTSYDLPSCRELVTVAFWVHPSGVCINTLSPYPEGATLLSDVFRTPFLGCPFVVGHLPQRLECRNPFFLAMLVTVSFGACQKTSALVICGKTCLACFSSRVVPT